MRFNFERLFWSIKAGIKTQLPANLMLASCQTSKLRTDAEASESEESLAGRSAAWTARNAAFSSRYSRFPQQQKGLFASWSSADGRQLGCGRIPGNVGWERRLGTSLLRA